MTGALIDWKPITPTDPPLGRLVHTKIDDGHGPGRNETKLYRRNNLWFVPDGSVYVYYTPTHYAEIK